MPSFDIIKKINPDKTFRVASIIDKFSLNNEHKQERFIGNIPLESVDWNIGLIYGHSGTGKSTIAKQLFKDSYIENHYWNKNAIIDNFNKDKSIKEILQTLNSVGFSSPPSYLKPFHVLSNGEKMRVTLARAILDDSELIVFDEFTSVVDRDVARISSLAINKVINKQDRKFIAISCHDDIIEWLQPDWIFYTDNMKFEITRGLLRHPEIRLSIYKERDKWEMFRKYHYLNKSLNKASQQYTCYFENKLVGFCAILHLPHPIVKNIKRCSRLVILPDYQGVGIGKRLLSFVAEIYKNKGFRFTICTSTPALINTFKNDKKWKLIRYGRASGKQSSYNSIYKTSSINRITTSWEFI